jgi:flagella basal body P-ring formation protein FlgA
MKLRAIISFIFATALCAMVPVASGQPAAVTGVAPASDVFTQEQLLANLSRQLTDRLELRGDLQLELTRPWSPPATGSFEAVILNYPARLTSSLLLQVRIQSGGRSFDNVTLMLKAQLFREVWVSRTPIENGSNFDPSQLDSRRVDVLQQRDTVPTDGTEADLTYTCSVSAGRLLTWRDLTRRTLVRKGQIVEVAAIDGTLTITTKALAMENGAAGDTVKLRNLESKRDFSALVVAEAHAQVRF